MDIIVYICSFFKNPKRPLIRFLRSTSLELRWDPAFSVKAPQAFLSSKGLFSFKSFAAIVSNNLSGNESCAVL